MRPLESKKASTICLFLVAWTLALIGPDLPFSCHSLLCCLVSGVWNDIADSSIVIILSNMGERWQTIARNSSLVHTRSFFMSTVSSLGTHLANFLDKFRSFCSMAGMNGLSQNALGTREFPYSDRPVILHLSSNIDNECQASNSPLPLETALVHCPFPPPSPSWLFHRSGSSSRPCQQTCSWQLLKLFWNFYWQQ